MKEVGAIILLNGRIVAARFLVLLFLCVACVLLAGHYVPGTPGPDRTDWWMLLIAWVFSCITLSSAFLITFSPLEEFALEGRPFIASLPLRPGHVAGASMVTLQLPGFFLAGLASAALLFSWPGTWAERQETALGMWTIFSRCVLLISDITLFGFCVRLRLGKRSWFRNGSYILGVAISLSIILAKSGLLSGIVHRGLLFIVSPAITLWDLSFLVLEAAVWLSLESAARSVSPNKAKC